MRKTSEVLRVSDLSTGGRMLMAWCPACDDNHVWFVVSPDGSTAYGPKKTWTWNGDMDKPTIQASLVTKTPIHLCEGEHGPRICENPDECGEPSHLILSEDGETEERMLGHNTPHTRSDPWGQFTCHSFMNAGVWDFLGDCTHTMAGQKVPMVALPSWLRDDDED